MKKVMVFGIFDGLHEGHRDFLRQAKAYGDYLVAVIAQDHIVESLLGKLPAANLEERFEHLEDEDAVDEVAIGDHAHIIWQVIPKHRPDTIVLGHNQTALKEALEAYLPTLPFPVELKVTNNSEHS